MIKKWKAIVTIKYACQNISVSNHPVDVGFSKTISKEKRVSLGINGFYINLL